MQLCILWQFLIVCAMVRVIMAGVKIEISRVKDPPTTSTTPSPNMPKNMEINEVETTEATTTTLSSVAETTIKPMNETNIQKITNSTLNTMNSTIELTTASPPNVTATTQLGQANNTNTLFVYNKNVSTSSAKDWNPYLSEFTRRQMRRRLIPADYYCPCDLKVN